MSDLDLTPHDLSALVLDKINVLGTSKAAEYFEVSEGSIRLWASRRNGPSLAAVQKCWDESLLCRSPEIWGGNGKENVHLLIPAYETVEPYFMVTLIKAMKTYGMDRIGVIPKTRTLIDEARNDLADKFLLTKSEWCIFLDVDHILPCGSTGLVRKMGLKTPDAKAGRNVIERLMSHPKDKRIVGALYVDRRGGNKVQCETAFRSPQENQRLLELFNGKNQSDALEETGWVGFGCVRIHRSVFEEMKAAAKPGGPLADIAPPAGREGEPYGYFGRNSKQRGEDVAVCRRAQSIGIKVYVDHGALLGHLGRAVF